MLRLLAPVAPILAAISCFFVAPTAFAEKYFGHDAQERLVQSTNLTDSAPGQTRLAQADPLTSPVWLGQPAMAETGWTYAPVSGTTAAFTPSRIEVTRSALLQVSENLKKLADIVRATQKANGLVQHGLHYTGSKTPGFYKPLSTAYDFLAAIEKDLSRMREGSFDHLSSHTTEQAYKFGLAWITDADNHKKLIRSGVVSDTFARKLGYLSAGTTDMAAGIGKMIGSGRVDDIEGVTQLLDGINKTAWWAVGYKLSGQNKYAADVFADVGGFVAEGGRHISLPAFERFYVKIHSIDKALISQYTEAQNSRVARGLYAQTIEAWHGYDQTILSRLSDRQRQLANEQFSLLSPKTPFLPRQTITDRSSERYREICRGGICARTDITIVDLPNPGVPGSGGAVDNVAGVMANQKPEAVDNGGSDIASKILKLRPAGNGASYDLNIKP